MTVLRGASVRPAASMDARPHPGVEQRREANGTDVRRFVGSAHAQSPRQSERCAALGRQRRLTGSLRSPETTRIRPPYPRGNPAPRAIGHNAVSDRVRLTCMPRARRGASVRAQNAVARLPKASAQELRPARSFGRRLRRMPRSVQIQDVALLPNTSAARAEHATARDHRKTR